MTEATIRQPRDIASRLRGALRKTFRGASLRGHLSTQSICRGEGDDRHCTGE